MQRFSERKREGSIMSGPIKRAVINPTQQTKQKQEIPKGRLRGRSVTQIPTECDSETDISNQNTPKTKRAETAPLLERRSKIQRKIQNLTVFVVSMDKYISSFWYDESIGGLCRINNPHQTIPLNEFNSLRNKRAKHYRQRERDIEAKILKLTKN